MTRDYTYLRQFTQWIHSRFELVRVLYGAEVVRPQRLVRLARVAEVSRP
jgi:hypothetical protein